MITALQITLKYQFCFYDRPNYFNVGAWGHKDGLSVDFQSIITLLHLFKHREGTSQEAPENACKAAANGFAHGVPFIVRFSIGVPSQQGVFTVFHSVYNTGLQNNALEANTKIKQTYLEVASAVCVFIIK